MKCNPKVYDFSTALMRCHALYYICSKGKKRTPKEEYEYLHTVLASEILKWDEMGEKKQGQVNGLKRASKISGLEYQIAQLEPKKQ